MPIRVHCPNGCLLRMPADRAGKMVRCPGCKAVIALPSITDSELRSGKPIPLQAELVQNFSQATEQSSRQPAGESSDSSRAMIHDSLESLKTSGIEAADEIREEQDSGNLAAIEGRLENLMNPEAASPPSVQPVGVSDLTEDLPGQVPQSSATMELTQTALPQILSPLQLRQMADEAQERRQKLVDDFESIAIKDGPRESNSSFLIRDSETNSIGVKPPANSAAWRQRLQEANWNRITLTKALATLVFVVGIINAAPAIFHWYQSWSAITSVPMPRWIYLQVFVAALHVVYAIFVFQVSDWSSLRAVSVAMLVFAFGFGIISTALLIEGGHGSISHFFSLSHVMVRKATIWTVSMLCLATLVAYISGKEANDWKRAEQLLVEILNKSA